MKPHLLVIVLLGLALPGILFFIRMVGLENPFLQVGEVQIPISEIEMAHNEMAVGFPQFGDSTLSWAILDGGFGPAWILHTRLATESDLARKEAESWKKRLLDGENFLDLAREQQKLASHEDPLDFPGPPRPDHLGGRVCALVASLEEGQWGGPVMTIDGWEIVFLDRRYDDQAPGLRSRAGVQVGRLRFPVGEQKDQEQAESDWYKLPINGSQKTLSWLPAHFRDNRVQQ